MSAALTFPFGYEIIGSKLKENREGFAPGPGLWAAKRETGENPVQQPLLSLTLAKALPLGQRLRRRLRGRASPPVISQETCPALSRFVLGQWRTHGRPVKGVVGVNIFLADDDRIIRMGLRKIIGGLSENYYVVGEASNGEDALAYLLENPVDLLITDIRMPVMDGIELIEQIDRRKLPVKTIVLSGFDEYRYIRASLKGGAQDYLLKPIDRGELGQLLKMIDGEVRSARELEAEPSDSVRGAVKLAQQYIEEHFHEHITLSDVAAYTGLSECYFSNLFKVETGKNYYDYLSERRIETAKRMLLKDPRAKIYEIGEQVGYEETITFNRNFRKYVGMTPREFRSKG